MQKFFLSAAVSALTLALPAAVEINVSSEPALPAANLVRNSSFEESKTAPWRFNGGNGSIDTENKYSGNAVLKLTGDPAKRPNAAQHIKADHVKAGDLLYMRFAAKNSNCDPDKRPASVAWQVSMTGRNNYLLTPTLPREDYDWAVFENVAKVPADVKNLTFYFCYYNQEGTQFFDDVYIQGGSTELKIDVKGENLQSIKVRHSVTGTILSQKIQNNAFSQTLKVPYFGSYTIEVTDKQGRMTAKLYPENVDANRSGANILQLTPGKRVAIASGQPESFTFELPENVKDKKIFLEFSARCNQTTPVAGYTAMLRPSFNGKVCRAAELVKPLKRSETASGGELLFARNNGYVVYYSNACYNISTESNYCPVSLPDRNPFNFKLDISKLVKPGQNTLKLENVLPARMKKTLYIDNLVLVTE